MAILSIPPRSAFLGKRAATSVYPGKKRIKGKPRIMRRTFEGKKAMMIIRRTDSMLITASLVSGFILKGPPCCGSN
jgi:hypothetical protein